MPKRTASFKYCSKRREPGCRRAKKTCSYRKNRTPKCQPKKSKQKQSKKKSGSKKRARPAKKMTSGHRSGNPKLSKSVKKCSAKRSIDSCNNLYFL